MNLGALSSKIRHDTKSRRRLRESVRRKGHKQWPGKWILHHDSAPAHNKLVRKLMAKKSVTRMDLIIHLTWPLAIFGSFQN
jgi:fatty acid-binding protein DegV